jgi:formate hydrogenlyase subunit 3/multisubunit Na+/H+ antiporter MnhD subunit
MKTRGRITRWVARIICLLAIFLISMLAFDVFSSELTVWQQIIALLRHLIPTFIMIAILIIAWKWERLGGIILILSGIVFCIMVFNINYNQRHFSLVQSLINVSLVCLPFVIAGVLFIVSHYSSHKQ